jgi:hypothetical protein
MSERKVPFELEEISRLICTELRPATHLVEATRAGTREGDLARRQLRELVGEIKNLALAGGCHQVIDQLRLPTFGQIQEPEQLPNWDEAGGLN